ncbi:unnamed protein product [Effrenium voratum]|uniref:Peptidase C14 caspase domain-containing protein n=1 Tax=Effrenium voratum TaxID=2562239 RepID=A0AA36ICQ7_9DINO|nr:unnamed protein product [Effrenium voratum]
MSDEWQFLGVDMLGIDKLDSDRDAEILADSDSDAEILADSDSDVKIFEKHSTLSGLCSEPLVFVKPHQRKQNQRKPDFVKIILRFAVDDAINATAQKAKEKTIKKLMIYYKGHGASIDQDHTVCLDAALVLEDAVVRAVERHKLEYACVIAFVDCCRNRWQDEDNEDFPAYHGPKQIRSESNTYIFVYFCKLGCPLRDSSLVPAALMIMIQAQSDCKIGHFLNRMSQLLLKFTFGRILMKCPGLRQSADALTWDFFPTGYQSPFDREDVDVMPKEHYDAVRSTLCLYGCLDCLIADRISRPEMLNHAEAMLHLISELRSIASSFYARRGLFFADWRRQLQLAMCKSLKVAQEPGP